MSGCRIKICGLRRREDIRYVNAAKPDFAGFILNYPKSHRSCTPEQVRELTAQLDKDIVPVGVFVNEDPATVIKLMQEGVIAVAQLHGEESPEEIRRIQEATHKPVIKAFRIRGKEDVQRAIDSPAEYILLDQGYGDGRTFDWNLVPPIDRPWFLAGGLNLDNLKEAVLRLDPFGVDLSSSVEIEKCKDEQLIRRTVELVRNI